MWPPGYDVAIVAEMALFQIALLACSVLVERSVFFAMVPACLDWVTQ
jgi:hypothetical protein